MMILSQDKEKTTQNLELSIKCNVISKGNFPNIKDIVENYSIYNVKDCRTFGTYDTEERAKEVLQEIIRLYKATETFKVTANRISDEVGAIAIQHGFIYEMPEK